MSGMQRSNKYIRLLISLPILFSLLTLSAAIAADKALVRVAAANATSGNKQSYDPGHGIRLLQAVRADVILVQEFNYTSGPIKDMATKVAGPNAQYYCEPGVNLPNGIISRFPIRKSGSWKDPGISNRGFAWSTIDIPGDKDLWAVSVHFKAGKGFKQVRESAALALISQINKTVPKADYLVIGGDFNTHSRNEPCVQALSNYLVAAAPFPSDQAGNTNTNASRALPYDWVLASQNFDSLGTSTSVGGRTFLDGLVFDTRVQPSLPSCAPALPEDSAATNMQHMVVVRDFAVPTSTAQKASN